MCGRPLACVATAHVTAMVVCCSAYTRVRGASSLPLCMCACVGPSPLLHGCWRGSVLQCICACVVVVHRRCFAVVEAYPSLSRVRGQGLCTDVAYPYTGVVGSCQPCAANVTISGFYSVFPNNDEDFVLALLRQPVSAGFEADQQAFQFYAGGVLTDGCGVLLNHAMLVVGYGTDGGTQVDDAVGLCGSRLLVLCRVGGRGVCGVRMPSCVTQFETRPSHALFVGDPRVAACMHTVAVLQGEEQLGGQVGRGGLHPHRSGRTVQRRRRPVRHLLRGVVPHTVVGSWCSRCAWAWRRGVERCGNWLPTGVVPPRCRQ